MYQVASACIPSFHDVISGRNRGKVTAKINLLTAARVKNEKRPGDYRDGRGLYLQVRSESSKSWLLKYSIEKCAREMGLGPAADIPLATARELRDRHRTLLKQGIDPLEHKQAQKAGKALERAKALTFKDACARYIAANRSGWRNIKHAAQWEATLKAYAYPVIGALPVQAIDTALVMAVLDLIWSTKPETASRVRGRIESIIGAAKARGEFKGENPATWKGHLDKLLPKTAKVRKVENHGSRAGKPDGRRGSLRRIGMNSLGPFLTALGLKLIAVPDEAALEQCRARLVKRNKSQVRTHQPSRPRSR
jgi:hypothetical protein